MLGRSLKMAFWIFHDHLGLLLIANCLWAASVAAPIGLALPAFASGDWELIFVVALPAFYLALFVSAPALGAGMAHLIKVLIDKRDATMSDFFQGVRLYSWKAIGIGSCYALTIVAFTTSAWFYPSKLHASLPILGYVIGALAVWCLAITALTTPFVLPTLVQKRAGVFATLRLATLLVIANPGLSIGIAVQTVMLTAITFVLLPLFFVGYGAAVLCVGSAAYELLARKYATIGGTALPTPDDANDDYLNRGLRDLFFPWKS